MGFICACHVVSIVTEEEDSCKCATTSLLQNAVSELLAPSGSGGGKEKLRAGHRGLGPGLLNGSPCHGGPGLSRDRGGPGLWAPGVSAPQLLQSEGSCAAELPPTIPTDVTGGRLSSDLQRKVPLPRAPLQLGSGPPSGPVLAGMHLREVRTSPSREPC